MLSAAPTFEDIAGTLATRIDGAVLVAHNLPFDLRMLAQEFTRTGSTLHGGVGVDTLSLTGCALDTACVSFNIPLLDHHRALADARATAHLLRILHEGDSLVAPATVLNPPATLTFRTLRREAVGTVPRGVTRLRPPVRYPTSDGKMLAYLHALNWVLDDAVIDETEREELETLARDFGLDPVETTRMHSHYLQHLVAAAMRDGQVTQQEHDLLGRVATALGIDRDFLPAVTERPQRPAFTKGMRICFTGDAVRWPRTELEVAAALAGYQPVANVTRKACDLLVAADPESQSGKAASARRWGIPIVGLEAFAAGIGRT